MELGSRDPARASDGDALKFAKVEQAVHHRSGKTQEKGDLDDREGELRLAGLLVHLISVKRGERPYEEPGQIFSQGRRFRSSLSVGGRKGRTN